jgi:hypothetical protein
MFFDADWNVEMMMRGFSLINDAGINSHSDMKNIILACALILSGNQLLQAQDWEE